MTYYLIYKEINYHFNFIQELPSRAPEVPKGINIIHIYLSIYLYLCAQDYYQEGSHTIVTLHVVSMSPHLNLGHVHSDKTSINKTCSPIMIL